LDLLIIEVFSDLNDSMIAVAGINGPGRAETASWATGKGGERSQWKLGRDSQG